jgi:uncharacterized membrane protein YcaP (DUF421 family)
MWFDSWFDLARVFVVGTLAYVGLLALLRVSGKRTLSKLNAFDLVVTVALGSTLATVLLNKDVSLAEGLAALALLCGLQFVVATASRRWPRFQTIVKAQPRLILYQGELLHPAMRSERLTEEEIVASVRASGILDLAEVEAVVLETDGSMSVLRSRSGRHDDSGKRKLGVLPNGPCVNEP